MNRMWRVTIEGTATGEVRLSANSEQAAIDSAIRRFCVFAQALRNITQPDVKIDWDHGSIAVEELHEEYEHEEDR